MKKKRSIKKVIKKQIVAAACAMGFGMGLKKINDEFLGIDSNKQEIVRKINKGSGGNKAKRGARPPQYPFNTGERECLLHLHGKAKKKYVRELKIKYADCRRIYS